MELEELKRLSDLRLSIREISEKMNYSPTNVRYWLKKYNLKTNSRKAKDKICLFCKNIISHRGTKYCSINCQMKFQQDEKIKNGNASERTLKKFLLRSGNICNSCGIENWNNKPLVLDLEHKDGNSMNNDIDNLELLCPNCHSQTPSYKGKNKGKGRHFRMKRYYSGKSF